MAMVRAFVTVRATKPLLCHHSGPDAIPLEPKANRVELETSPKSGAERFW